MRNFTGAQTTNDLTVAVIHTYYVVVNGQPVLVHNTDPDHIMGDWGWPGEANSVGSPYIWHADRADTDNDKQDWIPMSSWLRNGVDGRALAAVSTGAATDRSSEAAEQLRLWDVEAGHSRVLFEAPVESLAFAASADDALLVTGHAGGLLRIWNLPDGSLRNVVDTGHTAITDVLVLPHSDQPQVITLSAAGSVVRWCLRTGTAIGAFAAPRPYAICTGRLSDGRLVVATAGDGLSAWDVDTGLPVSLPVEGRFRANDILLSTWQGLDLLTITDETLDITTYDFHTGEQVGDSIELHRRANTNPGLHVWSHGGRRSRLAAISETLAVPTRGGVHLWNIRTGQRAGAPVTGPVAQPVVRATRWRDRDLLLTGSAGDGVIALWNLDVAVQRQPGHDDRISRITIAGQAPLAVSADERGTICTRRVQDGQLQFAPLLTGVEHIHALEAWQDDSDIIAATGGGSPPFTDSHLRRWNLTDGSQFGEVIKTGGSYVHWMSQVTWCGDAALVSVGAGTTLKIWRASDGHWLAQRKTQATRTTGFVTALIDGRQVGIVSAFRAPTYVVAFDEEPARPVTTVDLDGDFVVACDGAHIVTGSFDEAHTGWRTVSAWDLLREERLGPGIRSESEVTAVVLATWPHVYVVRGDGTVSLSNLETGQDLCPPVHFPRTPKALAVTDGGVIVGFGADLALVRPPAEVAMWTGE